MASLDRSLTDAFADNFTALESFRRGRNSEMEDLQLLRSAFLRLKGQELRLKSRIAARELAGGPLNASLAREDRERLKIVRNSTEPLRSLLRDTNTRRKLDQVRIRDGR